MGLLDDAAKVLRGALDAKVQADAAYLLADESLRSSKIACELSRRAVDAATDAVVAAAKAAGVAVAEPAPIATEKVAEGP